MTIKKGLLWSGIEVWTGNFFQLVIYAILSRLVPPSEVGLFAFASIFFTFFRSTIGFSFFETIIVFKPDKKLISAFFWLLFLFFGIATVVCLIIGVFVETFLNFKGLISFILFLCLGYYSFLIGAAPQAILLSNMEFEKLAFRRFADSFIGGILGIVACYLNFGVYTFFIQMITGSLTSSLLLQINKPFIPCFFFKIPKAYFSFFIKRFASASFSVFTQRLDSFFIGLFLGQTSLGLYSVALKIISLAGSLSTEAVNRFGFSFLANSKDTYLDIKNITFIFKTGFYFSGFVFSCLFAFSDFFLPYIFGANWALSLTPLKILCLYGFLSTFASMLLTLVRSKGFAINDLRFSIILCATTTILFLIFIKNGLIYAPVLSIISYLVSLPVLFFLAYKCLNKSLIKAFCNSLYSFFGIGVSLFLICIIAFALKDFVLFNFIGFQFFLLLLYSSVYVSIIFLLDKKFLKHLGF